MAVGKRAWSLWKKYEKVSPSQDCILHHQAMTPGKVMKNWLWQLKIAVKLSQTHMFNWKTPKWGFKMGKKPIYMDKSKDKELKLGHIADARWILSCCPLAVSSGYLRCITACSLLCIHSHRKLITRIHKSCDLIKCFCFDCTLINELYWHVIQVVQTTLLNVMQFKYLEREIAIRL